MISDCTQSLTAVLKPSYSPVKQYADDTGIRQSGYTDLFALGGTVYFTRSDKGPIPAVMRALRGQITPPLPNERHGMLIGDSN